MSVICPLCEHAQAAGAECEVCGRPLDPVGGGPPAIAPLDGLEPTLLPPAGAADPDPLPGLEPTRLVDDGLPETISGASLELEPTRAAPVQVEATRLADLEPTAADVADGGPTPLPAVTVCRYCRTAALPGERRCGRCGMRLPVIDAPRGAPAKESEDVRLCSCGAPVVGALCPACGARIAATPEG